MVILIVSIHGPQVDPGNIFILKHFKTDSLYFIIYILSEIFKQISHVKA